MRDSREPKDDSGTTRPRFPQSKRIRSNPSRGVVVGNSGILTSTRPGRLRSTSIRSGRLEASTQISPAIRAAPHFFGEHGVDAPANARVATSRIPPSQSLIRFVDEDVAAPKGVDEAEDLLEIAFAAPHPLVLKFFIFTMGTQASPARHSTIKVLPVLP